MVFVVVFVGMAETSAEVVLQKALSRKQLGSGHQESYKDPTLWPGVFCLYCRKLLEKHKRLSNTKRFIVVVTSLVKMETSTNGIILKSTEPKPSTEYYIIVEIRGFRTIEELLVLLCHT